MSTRSVIGLERPDGSIKCVYCHFDSYPSHHGPILLLGYPTADEVEALLEGGDISILGNVPGLVQDFRQPQPGWTLYYGRDREEEGTEARVCKGSEAMLDLAAHSGVDGAFLLDKEGTWLYQPVNWEITNLPKFRLLKEATIADLEDLIWRIPSLTHIPEESRQEWLREARDALEMVLNA